MWIPIVNPCKESTCAFIVLVTAAYWVSGCLPLGVTGILPVFLFSVTGIMTLDEITKSFFISAIWLFIGIYMLAIGAQTSKLHIRIALKILLVVGTAPKRLLLGFMLAGCILSMFIANIPVTVMLLPIAEGLMQKLKHNIVLAQTKHKNKNSEDKEHVLISTEEDYKPTDGKGVDSKIEITEFIENNLIQDEKTENELDNMTKAITLAIPYSSNIGGVCTLTGSVTNLIAVMLIQNAFPRSKQISFVTWFIYCTPGAGIMLGLTYVWILWLFLGFRRSRQKSYNEKKVRELLKEQYKSLGPVTWEQCWILFLFLATTVLWFTRDPGFVKGWGSFFPKGYITDETVSLGTGLLLFLLPKEKPTFRWCRDKHKNNDKKILDFKDFHEKFCWEVMFIAGGGLVLSAGTQISGLSDVMAEQIKGLSSLSPWVLIIILTTIASLLTESTTNLAIISLLIPVLAKLSVSTRIHPYYLCLSTFLATTLSFMLPVASPSNAIAYSTGLITLKDMLKTGWFMNVFGLCVINLLINTYGKVYLGLHEFPEWAEPLNATNVTLH